jgi:hypothetical protein
MWKFTTKPSEGKSSHGLWSCELTKPRPLKPPSRENKRFGLYKSLN